MIVDDEPLARNIVRRMLESRKDFEIVGECENGYEAINAINAGATDLVFLDVQMPEIDGFAVLESCKESKHLLHIIFVTAYDKYAVHAFEVHALDYLLKPFDHDRFDEALERAREHLRFENGGALNEKILALLSENKTQTNYIERLIIKNEGRVFFLKTDEIEWISAEGNYVALHAGKKTHLFREAISTIATQLDPRKFQRIHRSVIVNLDSIHEPQPWFRGDYKVILKDRTELKLSHRYRENLMKYLGGSL